MTSLDLFARKCRWFERNLVTAEEFVTAITDQFAGDPGMQISDAAIVASLIPPETRDLVKQRIETALAPEYQRQAFAMGGKARTKEQEDVAAKNETAREQAWAAVLKPLFAQKNTVMAKASRKVLDVHQFTLILAGIKELTPDVTDALFEAGFDDALVGIASGAPYIDVNHRQAESLEMAVREAIRDVEKAGFHVVRVESETANAITRINTELLTIPSHS